MYRFLLKPRWIAFHVLVLALMVTMVNLGFWQLRRLDERRAANREVSDRTTATVTTIDALPNDPHAAQWRRVTITGVWDSAGQVLIRNRSLSGQPGLHVVTPLSDRAGHAVLVNRGFIPLADEANPPAPPAGAATIVGRARVTQERGGLGPRDPANGTLTTLNRVDVARIQQQSTVTLAPFYLELITEDPAPAHAPVPLPLPALDEGPHLSYAIQWFIFTVCAAAGWVLVVRKSAGKTGHDRRRTKTAGPQTPP
jgi:cytochrome oxidase assembly protein ShyY1